jgi:hypothetical protein
LIDCIATQELLRNENDRSHGVHNDALNDRTSTRIVKKKGPPTTRHKGFVENKGSSIMEHGRDTTIISWANIVGRRNKK